MYGRVDDSKLFDNVEDIQKDFRNDEEWARWAETNLPSLIPRELKEKIGG